MKNKKKQYLGILTAGILVIVMCSLVSAIIGLSKEYSDSNPVTIAPGETKEVTFGWFQNTGEGDVTLKIKLTQGEEIASLTNTDLDSFVISSGVRDKELKVRISIEEGVPEGYEYEVSIQYAEAAPTEGEGMINYVETKRSSIPVLVQTPEKPATTSIRLTTVIIILLIVAILAVLITYFVVRKKQPAVIKDKT